MLRYTDHFRFARGLVSECSNRRDCFARAVRTRLAALPGNSPLPRRPASNAHLARTRNATSPIVSIRQLRRPGRACPSTLIFREQKMKVTHRGGVGLAFDDVGQRDPIVLVHGWGCHHEFFAPQIDALSAQHRVVAVDLQGPVRATLPSKAMRSRALQQISPGCSPNSIFTSRYWLGTAWVAMSSSNSRHAFPACLEASS